MKKSTLFALAVPSALLALAIFPVDNQKNKFHSDAELASFRHSAFASLGHSKVQGPTSNVQSPTSNLLLQIDSNVLFPVAKTCGGCHGHDPLMHALVTTSGTDVNIYDDWRSTMMANSSKDPFWRAKVSHEIMVNPSHSNELQDKCTSCHAPAGHYQAKLHDHKEFYLLSDLYADTLGLDGVTCQVCHAQSPQLLGDLHSGQLNFDTNYIRVAYGPYEIIFAPPMHNFVGITPIFGGHISDAGLCAGCHTLLTETVDLQGNFTGNTFVEQATYHEWLNSRYDEEHDNITCQTCHTPQIQDEIIISANYLFLPPKSPYGLHELAGANVTMLKLLKNNREKLDINAQAEHFDSTIAVTLRMLQHKTLDLQLQAGDVSGDSMNFTLLLLNKAGHKFPSGYPSRRAWVEFEVKNEAGQSIFHSGKPNPDYSLPDENANYEPHYNTITSPGQVQIYEMVPVDIWGTFTSVLERGFMAIKDNRLAPRGFTTTDPVYDTTKIVNIGQDPDFNRYPDGSEGSGADILHFRLPNSGYTGQLSVSAKVWYQSLPPKWMAPMFAFSSPEIDSFRTMFDAADQSPILIAEAFLDSVFVSPVSVKSIANEGFVKIFPTLTKDGRVNVRTTGNAQVYRVQVWDSTGRLVWDKPFSGEPIQLPRQSGVYFVSVETEKGREVQKVVRE
ncbi:MAG: T9SS type A sorting domain-containing protein [Phycisphaerae bacterium]|nr:T9SS type A sorting domain-containing protein [Saprospiraceae bacterium]